MMSSQFFLPQDEEQHNEGSATPGNMIMFDLRELTHFRDDRPFIQVLSDTGAARLVLFAFKTGQQLRDYLTGSQVVLQVLRGSVTIKSAGSSTKLRAGMVLQIEEHVSFDIDAPNSAVILLTMTPSPAQQGLECAVTRDLAPLVMRT